MYTTDQNTSTKTIMITVNGEPVGRKLVIDSVTYAPVNEADGAQHLHKMGIGRPTV
ncbi:hypothetical protein J7E78_28190 [Paenibacillus polymyxa]|uniref:hypothetical protein n=1 Tax=Paenibacillus polymyxa TaxID=1406 RepID=UPI001BEA27BD|nr:hypothetical protein [Paenibacillus polymyxa]MBT2287375.1 hypothetical protein [Paenibacillus polymyxa]